MGASCYRRYLDGEQEAFTELINLYHDNLIFFINRYVGSLSAAEEIAEDCFVALIIHPHRYNFSVSLKTYLFTIARNKSCDYLKHQKRVGNIDDAENYINAGEIEQLENKIIIDERKRHILNVIDTLNEDYRNVIYLVFFEELSNEETSKVMKKNRRQIENLIYRAKAALKSKLEKEGFSYED